MTPQAFLHGVLNLGLRHLAAVGGPSPTNDARRLLLAIALQESGPTLEARYQGSPSESPGPARGWFQFECQGGTAGVLSHAASKAHAEAVCASLIVVPQPAACWRALEGNDVLSVAFARLLVLTDPETLPIEQDAAWDCYLRLWRPGKPHPDVWPDNWKLAQATVLKRHLQVPRRVESASGTVVTKPIATLDT